MQMRIRSSACPKSRPNYSCLNSIPKTSPNYPHRPNPINLDLIRICPIMSLMCSLNHIVVTLQTLPTINRVSKFFNKGWLIYLQDGDQDMIMSHIYTYRMDKCTCYRISFVGWKEFVKKKN